MSITTICAAVRLFVLSNVIDVSSTLVILNSHHFSLPDFFRPVRDALVNQG
jgi:hypothetical protein